MSTRDMDGPTHAVIRPTPDFGAERLGKFDGARIPLQRQRFTPLTSILIVIDPDGGAGYRAHPTGKRERVEDDLCVVYHVSPIPVQVEQ